MLSFSALVGRIPSVIFGLPKSIWYGLSAGLLCGLLWALYLGIVQTSGLPASMDPLARSLIALTDLLAPVAVVFATGVRLGSRDGGSVVDGLIAGVLSGFLLTVFMAAIYLIFEWGPLTAEARAEHLSPWFTSIAIAIFVAVIGAVFLFAGIILGTLGALAGWGWRIRGQPAWRKLATLVVAKIAPFKAETQVAAAYSRPTAPLPAE